MLRHEMCITNPVLSFVSKDKTDETFTKNSTISGMLAFDG